MDLRPGMKLHSSVCTAEVIVIKGAGDVALTCGGAAMLPTREAPASEPDPAFSDGIVTGKRYQSADGAVELLCSKQGIGTLAIDGIALAIKTAKPLPSSD